MPTHRQRLQSTLIGVHTVVLVCALVGVPASLAANVFFGARTAEWVFAGVFFVAVVLGVTTALGSWKLRVERHRRSRGLCPGCGYDLRGSRTRCPECGRLILR